MDYREKLEFENVDIADVEYLMKMLSVVSDNSLDYPIMDEIDITKLDLDALVVSEFGITDIIGQISSWLYEKLQAFSSWITSGIETIVNALWENFIKPAINVIDAGVGWIKDQVYSIWDRLQNIGDILSSIGGTIVDIFNTVKEGFINLIKEIPSAVGRFINSVKDLIISKIEAIPDLIINGVRSFIDAISSGIDFLKEGLQNVTNFLGNIGMALSNIFSSIKEGFSVLKGYIEGALATFSSKIAGAIDTVRTAFMESMQTVATWIQQASGAIQGFVNGILKLPEWFREHLVAPLTEAMSKFASWIWEHLPEGIRSFFEKVRDAIIGFYEGFKSFIADPKGWFIRNVWEPLKERLRDIGEWIWERLPEGVKTFFERAKEFFTVDLVNFFTKTLPEKIRDLVDTIKTIPEKIKEIPDKIKEMADNVANLPEMIKSAFEKIGEWIWEKLPENIRNFIDKARDFITDVYDQFKEFIKDPKGKFYDVLKGVGEKILAGLGWIWDKVLDIVTFIKAKVIEACKTISTWIYSIAKTISETFKKMFIETFIVPIKNVKSTFVELLKTAFDEAFAQEEGGELWLLSSLIPEIYNVMYPIIIIPVLAKGVAEATGEQEVSGKIAGLGGAIKVKLGKLIGEVADTLKDLVSRTIDEIALGLSFNLFEPLRYAVRPLSKRLLTPIFMKQYGIDAFFEVPSFSELRKLLQRYYPTTKDEKEDFEKMRKYFRTMLEIRGLPQSYINEVMKTLEEWSIEIEDRFTEYTKVKRKIPLSPLYEMPSISEVCTFMVRDIIKKPEDFIKWLNKLGVSRDIALFNYLLHYRYPSPEKIADFVWRGIAGVLWNPDASMDTEVMSAFELKPEKMKAVAPRQLNFEGKTLFEMLKHYMKWHDYARFPWAAGWPTDNAIITDLLADIPGKIDLRWMTRWGIFEYWSAKKIGLETSLEEIMQKLLPPQGETKADDVIQYLYKQLTEPTPLFDIRQFCRTLQATGLHPYWIPWVGIAESINALTEERTLLRTGFMNLFEKGLFSLNTLNQLLAGFFTIKFKVGYYDVKDYKWKYSDVEVPVAFLPAESKLLELRSIFDRMLELYAEIYSEIRKSIRYGIYDVKSAKKILQKMITDLATYGSGLIKSVTGRKLTPEIDAGYIDIWTNIESQIQDIEKKIAIRSVAQGVLGWLLYRLAYGWVTEEDFRSVVNILTSKFYVYKELGDAVVELGKKLAEIMRKQEREVYVPTPSQIATFSEYMDIPDNVIKEAFKERNIVEPWASFWYKYITTRAISSETNTLVSTFRRIVEYFAVPKDLVDSVKDLMVKGGWTSKEMPIFDLDLQLRRFYRIMRTFVPTIRGFVTDAMYMDDWESKLQDWLTIRGIDPKKYEKQVNYYKHLIKARKAYRRFSWYLTRLLNAYCAGVINETQVRQKLQRFKPYGLSDEEIEIIIDGFRMEKAYREAIYGS